MWKFKKFMLKNAININNMSDRKEERKDWFTVPRDLYWSENNIFGI